MASHLKLLQNFSNGIQDRWYQTTGTVSNDWVNSTTANITVGQWVDNSTTSITTDTTGGGWITIPTPITVNPNPPPASVDFYGMPPDSEQLRLPPPREFNRYINASDLLEEFIRYAGSQGVTQREVLTLPIDLFIKWLILEASEFDGEDAPDDVVVDFPARHRCRGCGKFLSSRLREIEMNYCADECVERRLQRAA